MTPPPGPTFLVPLAATPERNDPRAIFDPSAFSLILEDPRLSAVRAALDEDAPLKAAAALEAALATAAPTASEALAWQYQLGLLRAAAGDPLGAAKAFDGVAASSSPLADYARYRAAAIHVNAGAYAEALSRARAVPAGLGIDDDLQLVMADALAGQGDMDNAAPAYRAYLGRSEHPRNWLTISLRFAKALLAHPKEERAEEAVRLARRVIYEGPSGAGAGEAREIEKAALDTLPIARRRALETPTQAEVLNRAKNLLDSRQLREAKAATDALIRSAETPSSFACDVWLVRAGALSDLKKKTDAADAYGTAIDRCREQAGEPKALFAGGKASMKAGRTAEAIERYALLEKRLPSHSYADDARLLRAKALKLAGDRDGFRAALSSIADDYPKGDMVADGLFELALSRFDERDFAGAAAPLERAYALAPRERAYHSAGRLPYFLARARIASGDLQGGLALYRRVIEDHPLSYYMALAYARLAEQDPELARRSLNEVVTKEPSEAPASVASHLFATPAFLRAALLAQQGDTELLRRELDTLSVSSKGAAPELVWAAAVLLARSGELGAAHRLLRPASTPSSETTDPADWPQHYPVGPYRVAWQLAYPTPYVDIVDAESARSGVPKALAYAIMREESAFDPRVVSHANAVGLMQLITSTAKHMAKPLSLPADVASLKKPAVNIALGCRYLSVLRKKFPDNPLLAIPGYNAGGGAPARWSAERPADDFDLFVERIPYEETRLYTKRVIGSMAAYEMIYSENPGEAMRAPLTVRPSVRTPDPDEAAVVRADGDEP